MLEKSSEPYLHLKPTADPTPAPPDLTASSVSPQWMRQGRVVCRLSPVSAGRDGGRPLSSAGEAAGEAWEEEEREEQLFVCLTDSRQVGEENIWWRCEQYLQASLGWNTTVYPSDSFYKHVFQRSNNSKKK